MNEMKNTSTSHSFITPSLQLHHFLPSTFTFPSTHHPLHHTPLSINCSSIPPSNASLTKDHSSLAVKKAAHVSPELKGTSIFLISLGSSLKTDLGKLLADVLQYYYFDSDSLVEEALGGASAAKSVRESNENGFSESEVIDSSVTKVAATDDSSLVVKKKAANVFSELKGTSIFMIGLGISLKTDLGKLLADVLRYYYFDSDRLVEEALGGASAAKSVRESDENGFSESETEVLKQLSSMGRLVVCAGNGAVQSSTNLALLRHGISLLVDVPLEIVARDVIEYRGQFASFEVSTPGSYPGALGEIEKLTRVKKMMAEVLIQKKAADVSPELKGTSIFLIGLGSSLKTNLGKLLAEVLRYYYFDSDSLVEEALGGASAAKSVRESDEKGFFESETEVLKQLSSMGRLVVCAGNGAVQSSTNLALLRHGISLLVDVPLDIVARDVIEDRGQFASFEISTPGSYPDVTNQLAALYNKHKDGYATSDAVISLQKVASRLGYDNLNDITKEDMALEALGEIEKLTRVKKMMAEAARPF
ncbi:hypothetical protein TanjilG_23954 [Lupinus angustifolius]|nr:hypothetical protein TanjilG_23954 [Lupinus angustifolius]